MAVELVAQVNVRDVHFEHLPCKERVERGAGCEGIRSTVHDTDRYADPQTMEFPDDAAAREYAIRVIRELQRGDERLNALTP